MDTQTTKKLNDRSCKELYKKLKEYYAHADISPEWAERWTKVENLANYKPDEWGSVWRDKHKELYRQWEDAHKAESRELRSPIFSDEGGYIPAENFIEKAPSDTFFNENRDKIAALTHHDDVMRCPCDWYDERDEKVNPWEKRGGLKKDKPRILFIGREANCFGEGLDWALDESNPVGRSYSWFRKMAYGGPTKKIGVTKIAFASYLLLENVDTFKTALESGTVLGSCKFEEYDSSEISNYLEAMKNVAIMNLNKRGGFGGGSADDTLYKKDAKHGAYLLRYTPFILAEVKLFNPDIIVVMSPKNCDDWKWFKKMLTDDSVPKGLKLDHNVILCDTYHFSLHHDSREDFVRRIVGIDPVSKRYHNYDPPQLISSPKSIDS